MIRESIRLGTIAGVRVGINYSVLVIGAILVLGLAGGLFPSAFPGQSSTAYVLAAIATTVLFFASLLAHEVAHAVVANRNGIEVEGITLWLFGGVAQLKGEPRTPGADFRIAVIGPLTSLAVAVISGVLAWGLDVANAPNLLIGMFSYLAGINVLLAIFNLVPAAPLDGGRVLRAALWAWRKDRVQAALIAARAGRVFGFVLMAIGFLQVVSGAGFSGLWLVLIGMFLVNAAGAEEQHTQVTSALAGLRVRDVMTPDPVTADPTERLDHFVSDTAWRHRYSTYPLVGADGHLEGLATLNRVRSIPEQRRGETTLRDIACTPDELPLTTPQEPLVELLPRMANCSDGRAVVVDDKQRVVGIVSPSDISRAMQLQDLRAFDPYSAPGGADLTSIRSASPYERPDHQR